MKPQEETLIRQFSPFLNPKLLGRRRKRKLNYDEDPNALQSEFTLSPVTIVERFDDAEPLTRVEQMVERLFPKDEVGGSIESLGPLPYHLSFVQKKNLSKERKT